MKGIVVELRNKEAIVLSDSGSVITIKNNNYQIGEEIQMGNTKKSKVKFIAVAAGFIIAFTTVGGGAYAYNKPYSYVSLDVNPSIEYSVNVFDRVIDATAVNEDGEAILDNIDVENKTIDEAIKDTVSEISDQGYITEDETGGIVISTSSDNDTKSEELADELKSDAEEVISEKNLEASVEVLSVGKERVQEARELGVTPGKLNLVEKLQKSAANPDDISIEEWINKPVKDIMKATKANREEQKTKPEQAVTNDNSEQVDNNQSEDTNVQDTVEKANTEINENKSIKSTEKKSTSNASIQKSENKSDDNKAVEKHESEKDNNKSNGKNK